LKVNWLLYSNEAQRSASSIFSSDDPLDCKYIFHPVSAGDSSISSSSVGVRFSVIIPLDCKTDRGMSHTFPLFIAPGNSPAAALLRQLLSDFPVLAAISGGVKYRSSA